MQYNSIVANLKSYTHTQKDDEDFAGEGGTTDIYKQKDAKVKLIIVTQYGSMGKNINEYYLDQNQKLFFIVANKVA